MQKTPVLQLLIAIVLLTASNLFPKVRGHGYLIEPPSRSSLWRLGYDAPQNYNDNALRCGGSKTQCSVCGDPIQGPKDNQAGGKYAKGIIAREYRQGQVISITIVVTANHRGRFEFHLCPHNDVTTAITEECLMDNPLSMENGEKSYHIQQTQYGRVHVRVRLPDKVTCSQCVLRWRWTAGNSWGRDKRTGRGCIGCGPQERFFGCSDIRINPLNGPSPPVTNNGGSQINGNAKVPSVISSQNGNSPRKSCKAINNWAGNDELDKWCDVSCNVVNYCPAVFCSCTN